MWHSRKNHGLVDVFNTFFLPPVATRRLSSRSLSARPFRAAQRTTTKSFVTLGQSPARLVARMDNCKIVAARRARCATDEALNYLLEPLATTMATERGCGRAIHTALRKVRRAALRWGSMRGAVRITLTQRPTPSGKVRGLPPVVVATTGLVWSAPVWCPFILARRSAAQRFRISFFSFPTSVVVAYALFDARASP